MSEDENRVIKAVGELIEQMRVSQNLANEQSMENNRLLRAYFGKRMEELTGAIKSGSASAHVLSMVIVFLTVVGTGIATLQWYSEHGDRPDFSSYSDQQLICVTKLSGGGSDLVVNAAIELCARKFPQPPAERARPSADTQGNGSGSDAKLPK